MFSCLRKKKKHFDPRRIHGPYWTIGLACTVLSEVREVTVKGTES